MERRAQVGWGSAVAATAVIVALLFLSSNVLGAVVKTGSKVDKAPFKGTPFDSGDVFLGGCKTTLTYTDTPIFNITNGNSTFNASTGAKACADLYGTDDVSVLAYVGFNGSTWTQATSASDTITFLYNLSWIASASAKVSKSASVTAETYIYVESYVMDETTGNEAVSGFASVVSIDLTTTSSMTSHKVDQMFKAPDGPVALTAGNVYYVEVYLYLEVYASVSPTGTSSASASLTLEPAGHQSKLVSITVS